ncbi:hypothetical protein K488DRAFT_84707 [Vararia minispora EC-137]|uniref:Uncharacterized protein n=1 Tax=Vararia minispora EC-137 TaxID=1314806 RepID=A0ACB8QP87_9AGAM|nr:hypothetical protein K488DRAFT_84707 [Vararia minispora EC-137]
MSGGGLWFLFLLLVPVTLSLLGWAGNVYFRKSAKLGKRQRHSLLTIIAPDVDAVLPLHTTVRTRQARSRWNRLIIVIHAVNSFRRSLTKAQFFRSHQTALELLEARDLQTTVAMPLLPSPSHIKNGKVSRAYVQAPDDVQQVQPVYVKRERSSWTPVHACKVQDVRRATIVFSAFSVQAPPRALSSDDLRVKSMSLSFAIPSPPPQPSPSKCMPSPSTGTFAFRERKSFTKPSRRLIRTLSASVQLACVFAPQIVAIHPAAPVMLKTIHGLRTSFIFTGPIDIIDMHKTRLRPAAQISGISKRKTRVKLGKSTSSPRRSVRHALLKPYTMECANLTIRALASTDSVAFLPKLRCGYETPSTSERRDPPLSRNPNPSVVAVALPLSKRYPSSISSSLAFISPAILTSLSPRLPRLLFLLSIVLSRLQTFPVKLSILAHLSTATLFSARRSLIGWVSSFHRRARALRIVLLFLFFFLDPGSRRVAWQHAMCRMSRYLSF